MAKKSTKQEGNLFDKVFKENLEELVVPVLRMNFNIEVRSMRRLRNKMQTTTEREADFLSEVTDYGGNKFILHVEFQSQDDPEMVYRLQEYHGMVSRKYKLPIRHFVFYFGNKPSKMKTDLPSESVFQGFTLFDFKTIDIQQLLSSTTGNEVVLAILADFKGENPEAVIRLIITQLRRVSRSEKELIKYLNQLNILSRLRNLTKETLKIIEKMPVTINIEEDFLYNQGVEKGIEKGLQKGIQEGELQGKAEKTREATINMLKMNCSVDFICEVLNVKESYVLEIKKELNL